MFSALGLGNSGEEKAAWQQRQNTSIFRKASNNSEPNCIFRAQFLPHICQNTSTLQYAQDQLQFPSVWNCITATWQTGFTYQSYKYCPDKNHGGHTTARAMTEQPSSTLTEMFLRYFPCYMQHIPIYMCVRIYILGLTATQSPQKLPQNNPHWK